MFKLRRDLDVSNMSAEFAASGRLRCLDFLESSSAKTLLEYLERKLDWSVVLVEAERVWELTNDARKDLNYDEETELAQKAYNAAKSGFAFYFESDRRSRLHNDPRVAHRSELVDTFSVLEAFLNSGPSLEFFRSVTSIPAIRRVDVLASRYRAGHFLTFHDDASNERRPAAFVINLTHAWNPAWGGLLQFLAPDGDIAQTYVPQFNALHLFRVPQPHAVSFVSPFAQRTRFAVSGWLHTG